MAVGVVVRCPVPPHTYDANGNLTAQTLNGQTTRFAWDDEDRLYSQTFPDGHSDAYSYTGVGDAPPQE